MTNKISSQDKPLALVVDDDLSLRLSMCAALAKAGFATVEAENGREALEVFQSHPPEIVLLDVVMPGMDGFATCTALRNLPKGKYTQILMVTGLDDTESIERAFEAGANDFIAKPINWVMLGHRGRYMLRSGRTTEALNKSRRRLAKTQELARLGNWEIDLINNSFHCSPEAFRLHGLSEDSPEINFEDFLVTVAVQEQNRVKEKIRTAVKLQRPFSINYQVILRDGTQLHILNRCEIIYNQSGSAEIMMGAVQDVTQLKTAEEEIHHLAYYDRLTGLANRTLFMDRLGYEISAATRNGKLFALLFIDLDQFKRINDTLGHHIGDLLLKNVSETLKKCIRKNDTVTGPVAFSNSEHLIARLVGDEFIILLTDIQRPENAAIVARKIIQTIPETFFIDGHEISVTSSIGISVFPADGEEMEILLKNADSAMYHAKKKGKNNYQFYKKSLNDAVLERYSLEQGIRNALKNDEFVLYYQPQIALSTRKIVGAEALIRWLHPKKGMIPPDKFIPLAEETGLIVDINKWVIQTACRQNEQWRREGLEPIRIAVNLSGYRLAGQNIIQIIEDALLNAGLDAGKLEIEITENVFMQETEDNIEVLRQMKDLKLKIALDDFGTGYSSLSYLTSFPIDIIKIDRSFVMGSTMLKNNRVVIKAIIAMGHSLGMKIIAEGIETEEQFELIKGYGADEGQGYYFSPPVPCGEFAGLMLGNAFL